MRVTRLDLDGVGSPLAIATKILKYETDLPIPVPIEELAQQLDVNEIRDFKTSGFVGGLLTDFTRSFGIILVQQGLPRRRRRFTIGHELSHYLIPTHQPIDENGFRCSKQDMHRWSAKKARRNQLMEAQANELAALLLLPPPQLRAFLSESGEPDIAQVLALHEAFDVSKEAAARAYSMYHDQHVAIIVAKNHKVLRVYRNRLRFPKLAIRAGDSLPRSCRDFGNVGEGTLSEMGRAMPGDWLESEWGKRLPATFQQVLVQRNGFALIMLTVELGELEEFDPDEERTSKERLTARLNRDR